MATTEIKPSFAPPLDGPETTILDPDGDLHLLVGPERHVVIVCSRSLRRTSAVWKTMLFGNFAEAKSKAGEEWVIRLPDDRSEPALAVLAIIHNRFDLVPAIPTAMELYQILVITEKYDMTEITRPWARQWIDYVQQTTRPILAWIAWELGESNIFNRAVDTLAVTCGLNEEGQLVTEKGALLAQAKYDALRPTDILEHILTIRLDILGKMLSPLRNLVNNLKKSKSKCCKTCAMTNLGSLTISAADCNLDPLPMSASDYRGSVVELEEKFDKLSMVSSHDGPNSVDPLPAVRSLVKLAVENRHHATPAFYLEHMESQRKKSGILV
ncbi:hypothetical protein B0J13DRAFT_627915 [Dactylonectria estremocensis]|uniref:BTB domain-containing protein n=1 Tax=Dactylonectria estremocensis TaxID=1079267 RepID=A0A9P9DW26_9HYPO|nr:hypothetical protein B0J13DRAFT_627915 [Dactylonectria estremocensis]